MASHEQIRLQFSFNGLRIQLRVIGSQLPLSSSIKLSQNDVSRSRTLVLLDNGNRRAHHGTGELPSPIAVQLCIQADNTSKQHSNIEAFYKRPSTIEQVTRLRFEWKDFEQEQLLRVKDIQAREDDAIEKIEEARFDKAANVAEVGATHPV
jgi:hypothetical protein